MWKLKQITSKSEYEIFLIAAQEKGRPGYWAEKHFTKYLEDQTLPVYVKQFLEDSQEYINAYRPNKGDIFNKKVLIFYSLFSIVIIGGSFIFCLYIYPRIFNFDFFPNLDIANFIKENPRWARPFINRAISLDEKGQVEKACSDLKLACDLGYCEYYNTKIKEGVCQSTLWDESVDSI